MSPDRVPPYEMGRHDHDDELEQLNELEAFSEGLRAAFPARPIAAEDEHIASMIAEAHLLADTGDPVVRPVSNADAPGHQVSWLPKQRRNRMQEERNRSKRVVIKVLAPATVFFALLGGVAWAGGLPAPLQRTASHVAGFAGVTLDDGTDATEVETPDPTETDAPDATDNQDGDHQGENNQDATAGEDNQGDNNDQGATTGDNSGEDNQDSTSGDDNQGENNQDATSGDDNSGEGSQDSTSGDNSGDNSGEGSGDSGGSSDNSGDSSGDSGGDSGSDSSGSGSSGGGQD